jgi:hypothetical protein
MNESNIEKEDFIRLQGIPFRVGEPLSDLYKYAQIKARTKSECFGSHLPSDPECLSCYMMTQRYCVNLTKHNLKFRSDNNKSDANILRIKAMDGAPLDSVLIDTALAKIGFKSKDSKSYLIARLILSSNGKQQEVLKREIMAIIGPKSNFKDVSVRMSQIVSRIHQYSDLRVTRETVKYIRIIRKGMDENEKVQ